MKIKLRLWVKILLIIIISFTLFILYSRYIGTSGLIIKEYSIVNSKIPENFYGLKIVQISDIHYNITTTKDKLKEVVDKINLLKPDIVILSGDLFNKDIKYSKQDYKDLINLLGNINYNIGKYAIKGDNDTNKEWERVIKDGNFYDINDNYEFIYNNDLEPILLVGISSNIKNNHIKSSIKSINEKINTPYNYSILVLHEPDYIEEIDYKNFNLILSGHSFNGKIKLPLINYLTKEKGSKKYFDEYYKLDNSKLYISGGIGTDNFKFRFNNKPSFNLFRLRNK